MIDNVKCDSKIGLKKKHAIWRKYCDADGVYDPDSAGSGSSGSFRSDPECLSRISQILTTCPSVGYSIYRVTCQIGLKSGPVCAERSESA